MMKPVMLIGPTAVGKTALAVELALRIGAEIISADSMQVYKEMSIGTAKPTPGELKGVPCHLIDLVSVCEPFDVKQYLEHASGIMKEIYQRQKGAIITGGTGLYVRALLQGIIQEESDDSEFRKFWEHEYELKGGEFIWNELLKVDPEKAAEIHMHNTRRVIRALAFYSANGCRISQQQHHWNKFQQAGEYHIFFLSMPRDVLYTRINERVDSMFRLGLVEEVRELFKLNIQQNTCWQAIGYKEFKEYFEGRKSLEAVREQIKMESRRFAKRQMTWFNKMNRLFKMREVDMLSPDAMTTIETCIGKN